MDTVGSKNLELHDLTPLKGESSKELKMNNSDHPSMDVTKKFMYHESMDPEKGTTIERLFEEEEVDHIPTAVSSTFLKRKAAAEGMMDIALLTANANQLRFLLVYCQKTMTFYVVFALIILSLCLQIFVGIGIIYRRHIKSLGKRKKAKLYKHYIVLAVFLVTIINVFAAGFTTTDSPPVLKLKEKQ